MIQNIAEYSIEKITIDPRLQSRVELDPNTVDEYAELFDGTNWPFDGPLTVFDVDSSLWLHNNRVTLL